MNAPLLPEIPPDTLHKQRSAADPARSAWVSANAGSGKTFVLTQRVVRLLLGGTDPGRILCLTFTKAAAANMAIRIFETLARWVALDDRDLAREIVATGAARPGPAQLAAARRLFARTVETPGGLKILTIHAFCERLLHAFPFEANVAAGFTVIEDLRQEDLLARAREAVLADAVAAPDTPTGQALAVLARDLSPGDFATLLRDVAGHRAALKVALASGAAPFGDALAAALGADGRSVEAIEAAMLADGLAPSEWDSVGRQLNHSAGGSHPIGEALVTAARASRASKLDAYLAVFLTQKLEKRAGSYLSKPLRKSEPDLCERLDQEQDRLTELLAARRAAAAHERTLALLGVAGAVLDRYDAMKRRGGLLDFDDLIERTRELVTRSDSAWILYKLDSGVDHLLVDEAQDTSPDQWTILQAITRDFFAGEGARGSGSRTFFAVGDEKQSIYSFQGARPDLVEAVREDFAQRARGAGLRFDSIGLLLSFRSVTTVLDVVDRVFAHADNARGLTAAVGGPPPHQALKAKLPGLVEIWPKLGPVTSAEPADWRLPLDVPEASDPAVIVSRRIADRIARMIAPGSADTVDAGKAGGRRPVRAGDVLILVRSRNAVFDAVIRALKARGVPVAGADRLVLTDHIATMDLIAAGRAALLPDDDLTLACLLKSPLVGLDDDDLIRLAPGREGSLEAALRASPLPRDRAAAGQLAVWRDRAAALTPFGFYMQLLGRDGGRRALLGRLGHEAADVIDEFVALTLAHERDGAPSLLSFLARLETTSLTIKRDLEAVTDAVRVMTVHAAKGLEAKVVFLPDTCGAPGGRHDSKLFRLDDGDGPPLLAWSPRQDADTPAAAARRAADREATLDEHRRLLYVALTRAEERLYIAGFHGARTPPPECWHDMIIAADLGPMLKVAAPWDASDTVLRRADPVEVAADLRGGPPIPAPVVLPAWIGRAAPREAPVAPPIRPSNALGAADRPDRNDGAGGQPASPGSRKVAALAGRLAHRLLQYLPDLLPARREEAARRFLRRHGGALAAEAQDVLIDQVTRVLADPGLVALFGPGSRAEVAVAATVPCGDGRSLPVTGQIDRVAVTADAVLLADFKSGRPRPLAETPPTYLVQIALYAAALAPLYPGRRVQAFLVWTEGPSVVEVDEASRRAALAAIPPDEA